jgi:outer membrane lipoprotein SlyB
VGSIPASRTIRCPGNRKISGVFRLWVLFLGLTKITRMKTRSSLLLVASALVLAACATPVAKPAFYPNAHYQRVGPAQAQADAQACAELAKQSDIGAVNKMDAGRSAATGAAVGGTVGVVGSVLTGRKPDLKNIAAGAAAFGVGSAAGTAAGQSVGGSSLYRSFVQQCLAERGYHVIGWH